MGNLSYEEVDTIMEAIRAEMKIKQSISDFGGDMRDIEYKGSLTLLLESKFNNAFITWEGTHNFMKYVIGRSPIADWNLIASSIVFPLLVTRWKNTFTTTYTQVTNRNIDKVNDYICTTWKKLLDRAGSDHLKELINNGEMGSNPEDISDIRKRLNSIVSDESTILNTATNTVPVIVSNELPPHMNDLLSEFTTVPKNSVDIKVDEIEDIPTVGVEPENPLWDITNTSNYEYVETKQSNPLMTQEEIEALVKPENDADMDIFGKFPDPTSVPPATEGKSFEEVRYETFVSKRVSIRCWYNGEHSLGVTGTCLQINDTNVILKDIVGVDDNTKFKEGTVINVPYYWIVVLD